MHLDISELYDLERDLEKGAAKVEKAAPLVVAKTAFEIEATAKIYAPVDTGNLEAGISTDVDGLTAEIGPTADYGEYVERGTTNEDGSERTPAHWYMKAATEDHTPSFVDAMSKAGGSIL